MPTKIEVRNVSKSFGVGKSRLSVGDDVSLSVGDDLSGHSAT